MNFQVGDAAHIGMDAECDVAPDVFAARDLRHFHIVDENAAVAVARRRCIRCPRQCPPESRDHPNLPDDEIDHFLRDVDAGRFAAISKLHRVIDFVHDDSCPAASSSKSIGQDAAANGLRRADADVVPLAALTGQLVASPPRAVYW